MSASPYQAFSVGRGLFATIGEIIDAAERERQDGEAGIYALAPDGVDRPTERIGVVRRVKGVVELEGIEPAEES